MVLVFTKGSPWSFFPSSGEPPKYQHVRPRSTSEAVPAYGRDDSFRTRSKPQFGQNGAGELSPPLPEDDIDLYPPVAGMSSLDFDPMSFQCSLASATPRALRHREGHKLRRGESDAATSPSNVESPAQFRKGKKVTIPRKRNHQQLFSL